MTFRNTLAISRPAKLIADPKLQLYWAARLGDTVELTLRGWEYWWLLVNDEI